MARGREQGPAPFGELILPCSRQGDRRRQRADVGGWQQPQGRVLGRLPAVERG